MAYRNSTHKKEGKIKWNATAYDTFEVEELSLSLSGSHNIFFLLFVLYKTPSCTAAVFCFNTSLRWRKKMQFQLFTISFALLNILILPVRSQFHWKNKLTRRSETLLYHPSIWVLIFFLSYNSISILIFFFIFKIAHYLRLIQIYTF